MIALVFFAVSPLVASPVQQPDFGGKDKIAAMKQLDWMVGDWKGSGWAERGGRKSNFDSFERIEVKAGGTVYAITGIHSVAIPGRDPMIVHDAFGTVTYDLTKKEYTMTAALASGLTSAFVMKIEGKGYTWTTPGQNGPVTYHAKLSSEGEWVEQGFESRGGKDVMWFEMKLKKSKPQ